MVGYNEQCMARKLSLCQRPSKELGCSAHRCCGLPPGRVEIGHARPSIGRMRLAGALGYVEQGTAHVQVSTYLTVDKELNSAPHSEHGGALVDGRAALELLGGHKTRRSKQTAHIIDKRRAGRFDEKASIVDLDTVGDIARVLRIDSESGKDRALLVQKCFRCF